MPDSSTVRLRPLVLELPEGRSAVSALARSAFLCGIPHHVTAPVLDMVRRVENDQPALVLVQLDMSLPEGRRVLRGLRRRHPNLPVVIATAEGILGAGTRSTGGRGAHTET